MILGGDDSKFIEMVRNSDWAPLIVLDQVEPNKMKAYNVAVNHPGLGDILIFSDIDCEFSEDFLKLYLEAFSDKKKNVITGRIRPDLQCNNFVDRYHRHFEDKIAPKTRKTIKSIVGSNFAVRKIFFFDKFGQFDESIAIGTDHAIAKRINEIGEPIYFDARIIVYTKFFSAGFSKYIKQQTRWIRIRAMGNRKSNPKAFRSSVKALLIPWLMCIIFPLSIFFSKHLLVNSFLWGWYTFIFIWIAFLINIWLKKYIILRYGKDGDKVNFFNDFIGAWGILSLHFGIQMIASLQLISKRHKFRW